MSGFKRFLHIERLDTEETEGILDGHVIVTPKIDGANSSVWLGDDGVVRAGSRNHPLSIEEDSYYFAAWVQSDEPEAIELREFCAAHPSLIVFGEFLVPHAIRDYDKWAWKHLFVFDVYDREEDRYLTDAEWRPMVAAFDNIQKYVVPVLAELDSPSMEELEQIMRSNRYLLSDAGHIGEGVVIRHPGFINKFGHYAVAKIVCKEAIKQAKDSAAQNAKEHVEEDIIQRWLTESELEKAAAKVAAKFEVDALDPNSRAHVGMLQSLAYRGAILDEITDIVKKMKKPVIDFGHLEGLSNKAVLAYLGSSKEE